MKRSVLILVMLSIVVFGCSSPRQAISSVTVSPQMTQPTATMASTELPLSPLPSLTPSQTLLPPPTLEPPTMTPTPTLTPSVTPTQTVNADFSISGLNGVETPTPTTTPGCEVRTDWTQEYEVQFNDTLVKIAEQFGTSVRELAVGNCLTNPDIIVIGQRLRVPGEPAPARPFECETPWEVLTPFNGTQSIGNTGYLTFTWRGPRAPLNLIRITAPDGSIYEQVVELRQNEAIDLAELPLGGTYSWQIYPLDTSYRQPLYCRESPLWQFTKQAAEE